MKPKVGAAMAAGPGDRGVSRAGAGAAVEEPESRAKAAAAAMSVARRDRCSSDRGARGTGGGARSRSMITSNKGDQAYRTAPRATEQFLATNDSTNERPHSESTNEP